MRAAWLLPAIVLTGPALADQPLAQTTVGREGRVIFSHRGAPVAVRAEEEPVVLVRIADRGRENDGTTLVDLRFIARAPGVFDLADFLERADGAPLENAPALPVRVASVLPAEHRGDLAAAARGSLPRLGGGWALPAFILGLWLTPLAAFMARWLRSRQPAAPDAPAQDTQEADGLSALVADLAAGRLPADGRARLERLVIVELRERRGLTETSSRDVLRRLRSDASCSQIVRAVEMMLHQPRLTQDGVEEAQRIIEEFARTEREAATVEGASP